MRISVVTISYNQAPFLDRAIRSIIDQEYPDIEYLVVDAGSTDGSREIIDSHRARIARIFLEPDRGAADGLNKGFRHATGDIFCFVNSDDALLPGALAKVAAFFSRNADVDVACGHGYVVDANDNVLRKVFADSFSVRRYIYGGVSMLQQSTFFRRTAFEKVGGFNPENRTCWDGELLLDFGLHNLNIKVMDETLSVFRIHGSSISGTGRLNEQYYRDVERLFIKAKRRKKLWFDRWIGLCTRIEKHVRNPRAAAHRVFSLAGMKFGSQP